MLERRATIRTPYQCRAQYCPSDDLLLHDGRMINLSERGAGVLAREAHRYGERVTISVTLPGETGPVTATGVVRWSGPPSPRRRWYPCGLEWLPLEETTRHRLHAFLQHSAQAVPAARSLRRGPIALRIALLGLLILGLVGAGLFGLWLLSVSQENRQLHEAAQQRTLLVNQLKQREQGLQEELGAAKTQLAATLGEVVRLDQHTQRLEGNMQQLTVDMQRAQESFAQARAEREALMQRVLDLEQERLQLTQRLSSIPELRLAIREAIAARKETQRAERRLRLQARRQAERQQGQAGNRGYLIREGQATVSRSTVWIRVHDPSVLSFDPSRSPTVNPGESNGLDGR